MNLADISASATEPGITPRAPGGRRAWGIDVTVIGIMAALWVGWLAPDVGRWQPVAYDTFRDAAGTENVLAGHGLCDPMIAGQPYWYAPLGPMLFAGISRLTGQAPLAAYAGSILWLNLLLPIGWYAFARVCWGWRAGVAAVPLIWLGSRWWSTHAAVPMTSTQGVVLLIGVLLAWTVAAQHRRSWSIAVGALLAACTWYHPLSGVLAAAAIAMQAWIGGRELRIRMLIAAAVCAPLVVPLIWHLLGLTIVNRAPLEFFAPELHERTFALQSGAWLIYAPAAIGLMAVLRHRGRTGVVLGYALAALVGQGLGYIRLWTAVAVPVLTPHEFQWHFQIAVGWLAACGTACVADWAAARLGPPSSRVAVTSTAMMLALVAAVVGPGARSAIAHHADYWGPTLLEPADRSVVDWIRQHTAIDAVFLAREELGYFLIAGRTGRKVVAPPLGHANVTVPAAQRIRDRERMFEATSPDELRAGLTAYQVQFAILDGGDLDRGARWQAWGLFEPLTNGPSSSLMILRIRSAGTAGLR
jgi:hypothetical protein